MKNGLIPEATISFKSNIVELSEDNKTKILMMAQKNRQFMIEGTAGGTSQKSYELATQRAINTADYLKSQGIPPDNISIVQYDPNKKGRSVLIYTIAY